jgi:hypothetical protein
MLDSKENWKRNMTIDTFIKNRLFRPIMLHSLVEAPTFEKILLLYSSERSKFLRNATGQLGGYTL